MLLSHQRGACVATRNAAWGALTRRRIIARNSPGEVPEPGSLGGNFSLAGVKKVNVHGRHVEMTEDLEARVLYRLNQTLEKLITAEYLEAEGGIESIDVRLMNTQAEIRMTPELLNKELHDTYLRRGELRAIAQDPDGGALGNLDKACEQLEKKLKAWKKPSPAKKDYRNFKSAGTGPGKR